MLKWILAVLAAGFVGQFGRVLAMKLIERHRHKQALRESGEQREKSDVPPDTFLEQKRVDALAKLEKKRAKAEVKKAKKSKKD